MNFFVKTLSFFDNNTNNKPCIEQAKENREPLMYEQSQNTILLVSTQAVYKAPHSTV